MLFLRLAAVNIYELFPVQDQGDDSSLITCKYLWLCCDAFSVFCSISFSRSSQIDISERKYILSISWIKSLSMVASMAFILGVFAVWPFRALLRWQTFNTFLFLGIHLPRLVSAWKRKPNLFRVLCLNGYVSINNWHRVIIILYRRNVQQCTDYKEIRPSNCILTFDNHILGGTSKFKSYLLITTAKRLS